MPIVRKTLPADFGILAQRGFAPASPAVGLASAEILLDACYRHPLNRLDDVRSKHLRFAEFEDEMIPFEREGAVFDLFGAAPTFFLFVSRQDAGVYLSTDWNQDGEEGETFEKINISLSAFARCHCRELSICFRLRSELAETDKGHATFDAAASQDRADELTRFIREVDEPALRSTYWRTIIYELEEGFYHVAPSLPYLIQRGRWVPPGAGDDS